MKRNYGEWMKLFLIMCICLLIGIGGNKTGVIEEGVVLPVMAAGTIIYLIVRDINKESIRKWK